MDIGVYTIHPMVNLFGKPNSLKASSVMLDSGIDGEGSIIFKYDELEGVVMYSKISNSYLPSEIQGENGSIIIDNIHNFQNVKIVFRDGREEELSIEQLDDDMYYEIEEFINIIQEKKEESQTNTLNNSKIVAELMEETRKQIGLVFPADLK